MSEQKITIKHTLTREEVFEIVAQYLQRHHGIGLPEDVQIRARKGNGSIVLETLEIKYMERKETSCDGNS